MDPLSYLNQYPFERVYIEQAVVAQGETTRWPGPVDMWIDEVL